MRKLMELVALLLCVCYAYTTAAQSSDSPATTKVTPSNFAEHSAQFQKTKFQDRYYVWLNFEESPSGDLQKLLNSKQIELVAYHSPTRVLAAMPTDLSKAALQNLSVQSIEAPQPEQKLAEALQLRDYPDWAVQAQGQVDVAISFAPNVGQEEIEKTVESFAIRVLEDEYLGGQIIIGRIAENYIDELGKLPFILFVDVVQEPAQRLNHENCVYQRVNVLNSRLPGQRNLTGKDVCVGIGDGGELGDHIDFGDRVINIANGTYSSFGAHGDHVAGIIGSAGNLNPRHMGMAPEATILMQKTSLITYYAEDYVTDYNMVLTNNSYGTSFNCYTNGLYNYTSQNLDWQMKEFPKLLHVYAAGNSGRKTCTTYPEGYRTVLRYYQSAKNVLTVGSVDENREIWASSSRGPVADGRLKPELCGIGSGVYSTGRDNDYWRASGTSMAAPSVVGTLALLVERFRQLNNEDPDGALMKAVACNSANDLGNPGPDYTFGYGLINGRRAVETLEEGRYQSGTASSGESKSHSIEVPAGTKQLRVMLYWHDKEAQAFPAKALINDLNIRVEDPSGAEYLPWVLNIDPERVADEATRGVDTLNNIEQVTLADPTVGTYTIHIDGNAVPFGPQDYYIVYEFIKDEVMVTFPFGGESLVPGMNEIIQWDADDTNTYTFKIEYSLDGGNSWTLIAAAEEADKRHFAWEVPPVFTHEGMIRVTKNGVDVKDANEHYFNIMQVPEITNIVAQCEGVIELTWTAVEQAQSYEVMMFDGTQMIEIGSSADSSFFFNNDQLDYNEKYWFSVRARTPTSNFSERAVASFVIPSENWLCPWGNDPKLGGIKIDVDRGREATSAALTNAEDITVEIKNVGNNEIKRYKVFYSVDGGEAVSEEVYKKIGVGESYWFTFSKKADFSGTGSHQIDAWLAYSSDDHNYNDTLPIAATAIQLANVPVKLPVHYTFGESNNMLLTENYVGLANMLNWDFQTNNNGVLRLEDGIMTLQPTNLEPKAEYDNNAILTLNMSKVELAAKQLLLSFKYIVFPDLVGPRGDDGSVQGKQNRVWVRGSDTDEWLLLAVLDAEDNKWHLLKDLNLSKVLRDAGQWLTSSSQIKFAQTTSRAIAIDDLKLETGKATAPDLLDFDVQKFNDEVLAKWATTTNSSNETFEVQVATESTLLTQTPFRTIATVKGVANGTGQQEYTYIDRQTTEKGYRYYRLIQLQPDAASITSPVQIVNFTKAIPGKGVFPNPFVNEINYLHDSETEEPLEILLLDAKGQIIEQYKVLANDTDKIRLSVEGDLPEGMYWLRVAGNSKVRSFKVFKGRP